MYRQPVHVNNNKSNNKNNLAILLQATITANMKIKLFFDRAYGKINNILYKKTKQNKTKTKQKNKTHEQQQKNKQTNKTAIP